MLGERRLKVKIHCNLQSTANRMAVTFERLITRARMSCRSPHSSLSSAKWSGPQHAIATLLLPFTVLLALSILGCTNSSQQHSATSFAAPNHAPPRPRMRRTDLALLAVQPAPDCKLEGLEPDAIDPDLWERLKLEYERNCYKQAEAIVRKRLRRLQTSRLCQTEPD
jgi:hypothetical protein